MVGEDANPRNSEVIPHASLSPNSGSSVDNKCSGGSSDIPGTSAVTDSFYR